MNRKRSVSLLLVGLFLWLTACTTYRQIQVSELADHTHVRITTTDSTEREFYSASIEADTIRRRRSSDSDLIYRLPLDRVAEVAVKETDVLATVGLVTLVVAIPLAIVAISYVSAVNEPGY